MLHDRAQCEAIFGQGRESGVAALLALAQENAVLVGENAALLAAVNWPGSRSWSGVLG